MPGRDHQHLAPGTILRGSTAKVLSRHCRHDRRRHPQILRSNERPEYAGGVRAGGGVQCLALGEQPATLQLGCRGRPFLALSAVLQVVVFGQWTHRANAQVRVATGVPASMSFVKHISVQKPRQGSRSRLGPTRSRIDWERGGLSYQMCGPSGKRDRFDDAFRTSGSNFTFRFCTKKMKTRNGRQR